MYIVLYIRHTICPIRTIALLCTVEDNLGSRTVLLENGRVGGLSDITESAVPGLCVTS